MTTETLVRRVATIAATLAVVVVVATAVAVLVPSIRDRVIAPDEPPSYSVGDTIGLAPSLYDANARTLVLFARSTCAFCQQARPIFVEAISLAGQQPDLAVVLVTAGGNRDDEVAFGRDVGLSEAQVRLVPGSELALRTVPSVALVDREGRVLFFQETLASAAAQQGVLRAIRSR